MFDKVYIYGLYDPRDGKLRYIGKTIHPQARLWDHITDAKSRALANGKAKWIRQLLKRGLYPELRILEECTRENWIEREVQWIADEIAQGTDLFNIAEGGDNPPDWAGRKQTPEHVRKRVEARKKRGTYKHTEKTKKKISRAKKGTKSGRDNPFFGKKHSEESLKKMSESSKGHLAWNKGVPMPEETKRKVSKSRKGIIPTYSEETKKRMIEARHNYVASQETREKLRQANLGKQHSEETKRKLSQIVSEAMTPDRRAEIKEMMRQKWQDPEYRRMQAEARKQGKKPRPRGKMTDEQKAAMRERTKAKWQDPEYREKMLEAQKRRRAREAQQKAAE